MSLNNSISDQADVVFTTKEDGNMSFKWGVGDPLKNREVLFNKLGWSFDNLIMANQPHGNSVILVNSLHSGCGARGKDWLVGYDGLISTERDVIIGVETADCLPVFAFDLERKIMGVSHAGWKGVVSGVVEVMIKEMIKAGSEEEGISVLIGPHIHECCFEIKNDVVSAFSKWSDSVKTKDKKIFVDLSEIVLAQLTESSVLRQNIEISSECTCCLKDKYYSYRREGAKCEGSMLGLIKLK